MLTGNVYKYNQKHTIIGLGQVEVSNAFLVEADIPADDNVVLGLRLLQFLVIVSLQLYEGAKDALVLVGIVIPANQNST